MVGTRTVGDDPLIFLSVAYWIVRTTIRYWTEFCASGMRLSVKPSAFAWNQLI